MDDDFKNTQDDLRPVEDRAPKSIRLTERYRIGALLGEGGMGEVSECRDTVLERIVALKVVREDVRDDVIDARFVREACVQAQLEHPCVVPVYDVGWDDRGAPFFTMRKLEGIGLDEVIRRKRSGDASVRAFSRHRLLVAFTKVCAAVDHAHTRGVLHRDLKPANVMLGNYGEVYVLDWGLAKVIGAAPSSTRDLTQSGALAKLADLQTRAGETLGTPAYMAPEQLAGQPIDARADVFALGAILFEILTLETLFDPKTIEARVRRAHVEWDARPSQRGSRDTPPEFDRICARATAAEIKDRYPSARALHDAVEAYLAGERDLDVRATLARSHLSRAEAAPTARDAIREVNRALALAPNEPRALALLVSLLQKTADEPSPRARAEVVSEGIERLRRAQPIGALLYGIWWVTLYPLIVLYRGVWSPWVGIALPLIWIAATIALLVDWKQKSQERVRYPTVMVMVAIAATSFLFSPLLVVPGFAVTSVANHLLFSATAHRRVTIVLACLAVVVPSLLAWMGVVDTIRFESESTFVLRAAFRTMRPLPSTIVLTMVDVLLLGAMAFFASRFRDEIERARTASVLFAWQLGHLLPAASTIEPGDVIPPSDRGVRERPTERARDTEIDSAFITEVEGAESLRSALQAKPRYEEGDVIEEEAEARVVRAHDRLIGRDVALKRARRRGDQRFLREAFVLARLDHPAVPPVYDVAQDWFTMELVRGTRLTDARDRGRHRLLRAFAQVCLTIDLAHARGVVHSALEPGCIVLGELDEVHVGSWSNASTRALDAEGPLALPPARMTGVRGYAAPEQAAGSPPTASADVFALGVILFEVLAGAPLFGADKTEVVLGRYDARPSARARERDEPIGSELDEICVRATAYDAAERYGSARELHDAVDAYLARDRDETLRASLAADRLERARKSAPDEARRVETLRELGRALALALDRAPALELLEKLLASPPKELPPDVASQIAAQGGSAVRRFAKPVALAFAILGLVLLPLFAAILGVRDLAGAIVVAFVWTVAAVVLWAQHVRAQKPSKSIDVSIPWSAITGLVAVSATSLLFGPHILVPSAAMAMTMGYILGGRLEWRRTLIVVGVLALLVPAVLGLAGVLDVFAFHRAPPERMVTMAGVLRGALFHPPDVLFLGLTIANVLAVLIAAAFAGSFRDVLEDIEAQNRAKVHALSSLVQR